MLYYYYKFFRLNKANRVLIFIYLLLASSHSSFKYTLTRNFQISKNIIYETFEMVLK
jgi:hypothetical protein